MSSQERELRFRRATRRRREQTWSFIAGNSARSAATADGPTEYAWRSASCWRQPEAAKVALSRRALAAPASWMSSFSLCSPKPRFAPACQVVAITDMAEAGAACAAGAGPPCRAAGLRRVGWRRLERFEAGSAGPLHLQRSDAAFTEQPAAPAQPAAPVFALETSECSGLAAASYSGERKGSAVVSAASLLLIYDPA